jgi:hypothetical protein
MAASAAAATAGIIGDSDRADRDLGVDSPGFRQR